MVKRSTAYFYILLSSFVLLAHVAIPHHQHKSEIFIVNPGCQTDNGAHKHENTGHKHKEHDGNDTGYCVIQQVLVRSNEIKYELKRQENPDNWSQFEGIRIFLCKKALIAPFPLISSNAYFALLSSTYTTFVRTRLGLRAPPKIV